MPERPRSLLTPVGWVEFLLPRVRCECGGRVRLDWEGLISPSQRISDGVDEEIRHWYSLGLSLRQLEREVERSRLGALGRRTLLNRLHQVTAPARAETSFTCATGLGGGCRLGDAARAHG
jgi:hypothetical protein